MIKTEKEKNKEIKKLKEQTSKKSSNKFIEFLKKIF